MHTRSSSPHVSQTQGFPEVSCLPAGLPRERLLIDIRKMLQDRLFINLFHRQPHMVRSILFHLLLYCFCDHVPGEQFVYKAFLVLVQKDRSLSSHRFRDQEPASRLSRIQCRRMNLNIVKMFQTDSVLFRYLDGIPGKMREIGRMLIESSDGFPHTFHLLLLYLSL